MPDADWALREWDSREVVGGSNRSDTADRDAREAWCPRELDDDWRRTRMGNWSVVVSTCSNVPWPGECECEEGWPSVPSTR